MNALAISATHLVGGAGGHVYVYDAATEELLGTLEAGSAVESVALHDDLIVAGCENGTLKVWGEHSFKIEPRTLLKLTSAFLPAAAASLTLMSEKTNAHSRDINSVAFSPDGKTIVSGSDDKTLKVWNSGER